MMKDIRDETIRHAGYDLDRYAVSVQRWADVEYVENRRNGHEQRRAPEVSSRAESMNRDMQLLNCRLRVPCR